MSACQLTLCLRFNSKSADLEGLVFSWSDQERQQTLSREVVENVSRQGKLFLYVAVLHALQLPLDEQSVPWLSKECLRHTIDRLHNLRVAAIRRDRSSHWLRAALGPIRNGPHIECRIEDLFQIRRGKADRSAWLDCDILLPTSLTVEVDRRRLQTLAELRPLLDLLIPPDIINAPDIPDPRDLPVDLFVCRDGREPRIVDNGGEGLLPLQPCDRLRLRGGPIRQALFHYVIFLPPKGSPIPLFPWLGGQWRRPDTESCATVLELPGHNADGRPMGFPVKNQPGIGTIVWFTTPDRLDPSADSRIVANLSLGDDASEGEVVDPSRAIQSSYVRPPPGAQHRFLDPLPVPLPSPEFARHRFVRERLDGFFDCLTCLSVVVC